MRWSVGCPGVRNAVPTTRPHDGFVGTGGRKPSRSCESRWQPQRACVPKHAGSHMPFARRATGPCVATAAAAPLCERH
jgi:hypothetical protein